ncbi:DsbA family protein [Ahrensia sp. R2A130]|uniref:DsbA family protein n=1 Tax=Ahrensia sp. R2A130 TaxID=744979 RepID=UPI0001E0D092|nr:DsbA family protein [Ahrensia sp. R2A130]EFL90273.1 dsba oxidoreductase [Ahrensia sp. R2A130]
MSVKFLRSALCAIAIMLPAPALALDDTDKAAVEQIIRDYLLANPELMVEVQQALEAKQQAEAAETAKRALDENRETIFASANQGIIGNPEGDVTVVEFFDYNCSFCQRAMEDMNTLLESDKNLKFVMKELPILSQGSVEASRVSTGVYRLFPEKYEEFHNKLLSLQGMKDGNRALRIAQEMGLDIDAINTEGQKPDVLDAFREANDLANSLGINGTPSYVIGDEVIFGALGADTLREKIENVRQCGKTTCS